MRKKFIAGNWKMFTSKASSVALAKSIADGVKDDRVLVAVCPPAPWLVAVADAVKGSFVGVGAQNCHHAKEGAYTGDISPQMVLETGAQYVIIGHSERRHGLAEPDLFLNRKVKAATSAGLTAIFCIGELLAEREGNQTEAVLAFQLDAGLSELTADQISKVVLAYEPVWAIGTGKVATPQQAQDTHAFIRSHFAKRFGTEAASKVVIQYGGSVKADNAKEILGQPDVDGALVGGASLKADSFLPIIQAAA